MNMTCAKCGTPASGDQAFCSKCGAVIGVKEAPPKPSGLDPNLARTIVGKNLQMPPLPKKPATAPAERSEPAPAAAPQTPNRAPAPAPPPPAPPEKPRSNTALLAVLGFVAVLVVGGLLLLLLYFFLRG